MNIIEIIDKKRRGLELTKEEIDFAINGYLNDEIKDYQMSAFLMAIAILGMSENETIYLTDVMLKSGDVLDLSDITKQVVDKHSTGGVGDKTTLIIAPIVASLGLGVAKMSGRGLGHTGGTIDKLESIAGFKTELSNEEFIKQVNEIGVALISQKGNLVPADKKIYALRDVTATTSSIPLIASSIMSKKLASGASVIILDVKVGSGAFLKDYESAVTLANLMIKIGKNYNKKVKCVISNMDEPLGNYIGNGLEVIEILSFLKGNYDRDLYDLSVTLSALMISASKNMSLEDAKLEVEKSIEDGSAYNKFIELVNHQGGNIDEITISSKIQSIVSPKSGYINKIDAEKIGNLVKRLGGGRTNKDDVIDLGVGFILNKKVGDVVTAGEELLKVYYNKLDIAILDILECFEISNTKSEIKSLIYKIIE